MKGILFFALMVNVAVALPPSTGFCPAKTDYVERSCAGRPYMAKNRAQLDAYLQNFGLSGSNYKDLKVIFNLQRGVTIHSPCRIDIRGMAHKVGNTCIDGRKGVSIGRDGVLMGQKLHLVSSEGSVIISHGVNIEVASFSVYGKKDIHFNRGVRLVSSGDVSMTSETTGSQSVGVRLGPGSEVMAGGDVMVMGHGIVNLSGNFIKAQGDVQVTSRGNAVRHRIGVNRGMTLKGEDIRLVAGNELKVSTRAKVMASGVLQLAGRGCTIQEQAVLQGSSYEGNCSFSHFNRVPRAVITASQVTGVVPFRVSFNSTGSSDPDGSIAGYEWTLPGEETSDQSSLEWNFSQAGVYTVRLVVEDNRGAMGEARVTIVAKAPLVSPTASFVYTPKTGDAPLTVSLDGSASSDPDGTIMSYEWIFSDGQTLQGVRAQRIFDRGGTYMVSLKVTDNSDLSHQVGPFAVVVLEPNQAPVMVGNQKFSVVENQTLNLTLSGATDPEGDTLSYRVVLAPQSGTLSGCLGGSSGLQCRFVPKKDFEGTVIFSYRARDGQRDSETLSVVEIEVTTSNTAPLALAGSDQSVEVGHVVKLDGSGSTDADGQALSYAWRLTGKPSSSRAFLADLHLVRPSFIADVAGAYTVELVVDDSEAKSAGDEVVITAAIPPNRAPVLGSLSSPKSLQVGTEIRFTLEGTDQDSGDSLVYSAVGMPGGAYLDAVSGAFKFAPKPSQVGSHKVRFLVSDGRAFASQEVSLQVTAPDAQQVTALKSRALDAEAFKNGRTVPIPGVRVTVVGSTVTATSDAQGYFTLSGIPHGPQTVSLDASGIMDATGNQFANFKGRLPIAPNVLNRPYRDYLLPIIDSTGMAMIDPTKPTSVNNTNINVSFTIPPQTAMGADGNAYTGPISVSAVPIDATPRELPDFLQPSFLITLQPVNIRFSTPVPIIFPNVDGLPNGSTAELWSLSEQGGFHRVGIGRVSGSRILMIAGGIRATTWHFMVAALPRLNAMRLLPGGDKSDNSSKLDPCFGLGSSFCPATGYLQEEHQLPGFRDSGSVIRHALGFTNPPDLTRGSFSAEYQYQPQAMIDGQRVGIATATPRSLALSLQFQGVESPTSSYRFSAQQGATVGIKPFFMGTKMQLVVAKTGLYSVLSKLEVANGSRPRPSRRMVRGTTIFPMFQPLTEMGRGWRLLELQRLYGVEGVLNQSSPKVMLVHGNFKHLVFHRNSDGSYTSPKGDFTTLEGLAEPFGGFIRTTKEGMKDVFDRGGFLLGQTDRYGRKTSYTYGAGKLTQITHHNETVTRFSYGSDGYLDTITDPGGRVTSLDHDASGNLIRITNPDQTTKSFSYSSHHGLISQTDQLDRSTTYAYDDEGKLSHIIRPDHSMVSTTSVGSDFFAGQGGGTPQTVSLKKNVSQTVLADGLGRQSRYTTDSFGSIVGVTDSLGASLAIRRDENNNIISLHEQGKPKYSFGYDSHGNLTRSSTLGLGSRRFFYGDHPSKTYHRPLKLTSSFRSGPAIEQSYQYDERGNVVEFDKFGEGQVSLHLQ